MLKYTSDATVRHLVDKLEWVIVPVVNVDGYIYTHKTVSDASCVQWIVRTNHKLFLSRAVVL